MVEADVGNFRLQGPLPVCQTALTQTQAPWDLQNHGLKCISQKIRHKVDFFQQCIFQFPVLYFYVSAICHHFAGPGLPKSKNLPSDAVWSPASIWGLQWMASSESRHRRNATHANTTRPTTCEGSARSLFATNIQLCMPLKFDRAVRMPVSGSPRHIPFFFPFHFGTF